jgi:uncharacterized membrane protein
MSGTVWHLAAAVGLFVGSHLLLSSSPLRAPLVGMLGERLFLAIYSVISLVLLAWILIAYGETPFIEIWSPPTGLRHLSLSIMPFSCILVIAGLTTPNPTVVGADASVAARGPIGILKVTRHPALWGFALWGAAHLLANGDAAGMILFGGMTFLSLVGARAIDAKKRATLGEAWETYCDQTSYLPMAALISRRTRLEVREIGYWRLALGVALYAVLLITHGWIFGVDPWPL